MLCRQAALLLGGDGADTITGSAGGDIIYSGAGADTLTGSGGADDFRARDGSSSDLDGDTITDFDGNDYIIFSEPFLDISQFTFTQNVGFLTIEVDTDFDLFTDITITLTGDFSAVLLDFRLAFTGTNQVALTFGPLVTDGTAGADIINGTIRGDQINGLDGNDVINGGVGNDGISGGQGVDILTGGSGRDNFRFIDLSDAGLTPDHITDFEAGDSITLGDGSGTAEDPDLPIIFLGTDAFTGQAGEVRYVKGGGVTIIEVDSDGDGTADHLIQIDNGEFDLRATTGGSPTLEMDAGFGFESAFDDVITGTSGDDVINTGDGNDSVRGMAGNDTINLGDGDDSASGFGGTDVIDGGAGFDQYTTFFVGQVNLVVTDTSITDTISGDSVTITNFEFITFSNRLAPASDDIMDASASTVGIRMHGGAGDDIMIGGSGDDAIEGDQGADTMTGGLGADRFTFDFTPEISTNGAGDVITDFETGDRIEFTFIEFFSQTLPEMTDLTFISDAAFSGVAGEYRTEATGGQTLIQFDFNGDMITDRTVTLANGEFTLADQAPDFHRLSIVSDAASAGDDNIVGTNGDDVLSGLDGDDFIQGLAGNDTLNGDNGDDTVWGGDGDDFISGGDGNDELDGGDGSDILIGGLGNDTLNGGDGDDLNLLGEDGNDTINGGAGNDGLFGGLGSDTLNGDDGNDFLNGNEGNDILNGGAGDDTLDGNAGVDIHTGGDGCDNFRFRDLSETGTGINADVITDFELGDLITLGATTDTNRDPGADLLTFIGTVAFSGTMGEFRYEKTGGQTIIQVDIDGDGISDSEVIIANGEFDLRLTSGAGTRLEIDGAFGSTTAGDDKIFGTSGDDVIDGGDGNDFLRGMDGNDTINGGAGDDTISDSNGSDIIDGGAGFDNYTQFGDHQVILTITDNMVADAVSGEVDTLSNMERITFSQRLTAPTNDIMDASAATVEIGLFGGAGDDILIGGSGDDNIEGDSGNDTMTGGTGADRFTFDYTEELGGADVITDFEVGDTVEFTFIEFQQGVDLTFIDTGAFSGVAGEYRYEASGGQTVIEFDLDGDMVTDRTVTLTNGEFTLVDQSPDFHRLMIQTDVPTPGDDNIVGTNGDDVIDALAGDDFVQGLAGNDTLTGNDGNDTLWGGDGDDIFIAGAGSDTVDGGSGQDVISFAGASAAVNLFDLSDGSTIFGPDGDITINSVEGVIGSGFDDIIAFSPNTAEVRSLFFDGGDGDDFIRAGNGDDEVRGGNGDDNLRGNGGDDSLFGEDGDDFMRSDAGTDTFDGGAGFDRISFFNLDATEGVDADLRTGIVSNDGFGNVETFVNVEGLGAGTAFADILHGDDNDNLLFAMGFGDMIFAYAGDDRVIADSGGTFDGGAGTDTFQVGNIRLEQDADMDGFAEIVMRSAGVDINLKAGVINDDGFGGSGTAVNFENLIGSDFADILRGGNDDNEIFGNDGDDEIRGEKGNDLLDGGAGNDLVRGGDGDDTLSGGDGDDDLRGEKGNDTINGDAGNDTLTGKNGDDVLSGGDGDDTLDGGKDNDWVWGGAGNDILEGGKGDDTFAFKSGDAMDTIIDFKDKDDFIELELGTDFDTFAEVMAAATQVGNDTVFDFGNGDVLVVEDTDVSDFDAGHFIFI